MYTDEQIAVLAETIPSVEMLEWCKENGYAVMPTAPTEMSLLGVREFESAHFCTKSGGWYADQRFASADRTSFGWLSIRKTPVPDSTSKNWNEQKGLLSGFETVPNVAEVSWFITTYFNVRGIRLFERTYVRTSSLDSDGFRVGVGCFGAGGLLVSGGLDLVLSCAVGCSHSGAPSAAIGCSVHIARRIPSQPLHAGNTRSQRRRCQCIGIGSHATHARHPRRRVCWRL